jgi:molecular chaperone HscC
VSSQATIGIDLGTTYSLVSVLQDGVPVVLANALGEKLTPSVVSLDEDGSWLVGAPAAARAATHPERTARLFKRDMGTPRRFTLGDRALTAPELSALVLRELKRDAEAALGMPVGEAVVTVPAYFGDLQRQATRDAAEIAGLHVERIINEPTAAALAYGLEHRGRDLRAVVLDLGGGTFDVTILEIVDGVVEIQASAGDARLGGEDFVDALAEHAEKRIAAGYGPVTRTPRSLARVREACELAKRRLSTAESTLLVLPALAVESGAADVEIELTREEVERVWLPIVERVAKPIRRAFGDASIAPSSMDEVLLVGGATRMPCVIEFAARYFGKMPLRHLPPDEAVAMGAAVQAALKKGDDAVGDMVVTDIAPFTLGIETAERAGNSLVEGIFAPILERGTVIPASRVQRFATVHDNQRVIHVEVYQGEHSLCRDNVKLGGYRVTDLPKAPAGNQSIEVRFTYDLNGILEVETTVVGTDRAAAHLVIEERPGRLTKTDIARAREQMSRIKFHPRDSLPNKTALARADALFTEVTGSERAALGACIAGFRSVLESQDPTAIEAAREELVALTRSLAGDR